MNVFQVMGMLRHRYPFLFVDGVVSCTPGKAIEGFKNVSGNETLLGRGRNAGAVFPHLLIVEALAQVSVILTYRTLGIAATGDELMVFAGIEAAHFSGDVRPGNTLKLKSELIRIRQSIGWFRGVAEVSGETVASMRMIAAIRSTSAA